MDMISHVQDWRKLKICTRQSGEQVLDFTRLRRILPTFGGWQGPFAQFFTPNWADKFWILPASAEHYPYLASFAILAYVYFHDIICVEACKIH